MNSRKSYNYDTKKQAVELFFEGLSIKEIGLRLEIQHASSIRKWAREVKAANSFEVLHEKRRGPNLNGTPRTELEVTKAELERAKLEIMYLKKLIALKKE